MSHRLIVHSLSHKLFWPGGEAICALGKSGICPALQKTEGDGKTPLGTYPLRGVYFRQDRIGPLRTFLPQEALEPDMGWCDASDDPCYNQFVRHPYAASAEHLWREDGLYDIIVVLGHNDAPVVPCMGSAIFLHCCTYDETGVMTPTLGCVAVPRDALLTMLAEASTDTMIEIF
jgi:L,D-peptidoglycan transpeptidase YkuD (ErfK/YbiS/YcfS/YnhG family)